MGKCEVQMALPRTGGQVLLTAGSNCAHEVVGVTNRFVLKICKRGEKMQAIILAAGYATRMYPLTENTPKALLPLRGKPVIDHIVAQLDTLPNVKNIYVVTNSKFYPSFCRWSHAFNTENTSQEPGILSKPDAVSASPEMRIEVLDDGTTSNENRRGAVGDVLFAIREKKIDDELVVIAGDNYFADEGDLAAQFALFRKTGCDTLCGKELHDPARLKNFGIAQLAEDGKLLHFEEKPQNPRSNIVVYAAYFFRRETVPLFEKYLAEGNSPDNIGSFPQWLYKFCDVYTHKLQGDCHDIGSIEEYENLGGVAPKPPQGDKSP